MIYPLEGKPAQSVALATHRLNIWEGAVRSSKTVASLIAWLDFVRSTRGPHVAFGWSQDTIYRNVVYPLQQWLGHRVTYNAGQRWFSVGNRRVWIVGANNEPSQNRIKGVTLQSAYGDELSSVPRSFFRMLTSRLSLPDSRLYGTTNPDAPTHWLMADYLENASAWLKHDGSLITNDSGLDLIRFSFNLDDNPHLTEEYKRQLAIEHGGGVWYQRYVLGEWVAGEGLIWDMFDPGWHVRDIEVPAASFGVIAMDYGTNHPFAAGYGRVGAFGVHVADEWVYDSKEAGRQLTDVEYSRRLGVWAAGKEVDYSYLDPAAASMYQQLRSDGWSIRDADNSVADGLRWVASLFSTGRLTVSPHNKRLIACIERYAWDEKSAGEKPIKVGDDEADMLRYLVASTRWLWRS